MSTSMYMFINSSNPYMSYNFVLLDVEILATVNSSFLHPSNNNAKTNVNKFSCTTDLLSRAFHVNKSSLSNKI